MIRAQGLTTFADLKGIDDDSIDVVYTLNVLEHIVDDVGAIEVIRRKLRVGGTLLIYVPAFPLLYSRMDAKVGHVRRYRLAELHNKVTNAGLTVTRLEYVDSLGFLMTLAYRACGSKSGDINPRALRAYDRFIFPLSRLADHTLKRVVGKNLLLVAKREI
jgi:predicted SAM-dependent methyltransferase